jgi:acyl carrier protein
MEECVASAPNQGSLMNSQDIKTTVKTFILNEDLPGEDPAALTDTTALMTTGILDSIAVLKVVTFLENQFGITIEPHEAVVENLNSLSDIARLVMSKKSVS